MLRFGIGGDGFLDRIRALSFAMLGLTAAAALALVAFIANQGWPQVGSLLPVPAVHRAELSENSIVARPASGRHSSALVVTVPPLTLAPVPSGGTSGEGQPSHQGAPAGSDAGPASNVVVLAPQGPESTPSSPGTGASPSQPAPAPVSSEAPVATPAETTPAVAPQPVATPTTPVTAPPSTPTTTPTTPETPIPGEPTPDEPIEEGGEEVPSTPSEEPTEPESTPEPPLPDEGEPAPEVPDEVPAVDPGLEH